MLAQGGQLEREYRQSPMERVERLALADDLEAALRRHVAEAWFPRCVDRERGGFLQDFDRRWRPSGPQERLLEFQARQTRAAARLALAYPGESVFADAAAHGLRYLRDVMWDGEHGGWYWLLDRSGTPLADGLKHGHGAAYAVHAAALVHRATGDPDALEVASRGFRWFDDRAHDREHAGYHGWLTRDGRPVTSPAEAPVGAVDPLEHAPGLKDVNVHSDWMEALQVYAPISGDSVAGERLRELGGVFVERISNAAGEMHYAFHPDWWPQPGLERFGYVFQTATRLLALADVPGAAARSRALVRHALGSGAAPVGGYIFAAPAGPPLASHGRSMVVPVRAWWVQFEALRALVSLAFAGPDDDESAALEGAFIRQWRFIRDEMLDIAWGGVYECAVSDLPVWRRPVARLRRGHALRKGEAWKDASHDTDALLTAIRLLRGIPDGAGGLDAHSPGAVPGDAA